MTAKLSLEREKNGTFKLWAHHHGKKKLEGISEDIVWSLLRFVNTNHVEVNINIKVSEEEAKKFTEKNPKVHTDGDRSFIEWLNILSK